MHFICFKSNIFSFDKQVIFNSWDFDINHSLIWLLTLKWMQNLFSLNPFMFTSQLIQSIDKPLINIYSLDTMTI